MVSRKYSPTREELKADRTLHANVVWTEEVDGYSTGVGGRVAYVVLPDLHPDIGNHPDNLPCPVNGGFTYLEGGIMFGWDYKHHWDFLPSAALPHKVPQKFDEEITEYIIQRSHEDVARALDFFRSRATRRIVVSRLEASHG
jgi:hypothetical protein